MKYVVFQSEGSAPFVVLMSNCVMHSSSHAMVRHNDLRGTGDRHNWAKPISAGFVEVEGGTIRCFGESESLDLKSRGDEDVAIVTAELNKGRYG